MAIFVEWLRATRRMSAATPEAVRQWEAADRDAFLAAVAAFANLDAARGVRANLLRHAGAREALVMLDAAGGRLACSRDALRAGGALPPAIEQAIASLTWGDLLDLAADHMLQAGTRPDDQLLWSGDQTAAWPYGAWIVGATVVLVAPAA